MLQTGPISYHLGGWPPPWGIEYCVDVLSAFVDFRPTPGMPADVYIKTGKRTFFEYIMRPVLDSFARAFRES